MKIKIGILLLLIIVLVQGCVPSLHPLWSKDKLIYKPELNGRWLDEESDDEKEVVWEFSGGFNEADQTADSYDLVHNELKAKAEFEVHLVKLGETLFFDFFPGDVEDLAYDGKKMSFSAFSNFSSDKQDTDFIHLNSLYYQHLLPVHTFAKVEIEGGKIKIFQFDPEYIDKLFKERRIRIQHEETAGGQMVLTAPTSELQKFFEKYANDEKAFLDPIVLVREGKKG